MHQPSFCILPSLFFFFLSELTFLAFVGEAVLFILLGETLVYVFLELWAVHIEQMLVRFE